MPDKNPVRRRRTPAPAPADAGAGVLKRRLDRLYRRYNRREFVHPDPLELLYRYEDVRDGEIVGLVASSLAYGRVRQISRSVGWVLDRMQRPSAFLQAASRRSLSKTFRDFKHRFTPGEELARLLFGAKLLVEKHGSLCRAFRAHLREGDEDVLGALTGFARELARASGLAGRYCSLLPRPEKGGASKRLHLYLRWMVRRDAVDPGGWEGVPASMLIVPLDTHMHRIALALGLTRRRRPDARAALEVTRAFRELAPEDPVRYDFALTRLGIRPELSVEGFVRECRKASEWGSRSA